MEENMKKDVIRKTLAVGLSIAVTMGLAACGNSTASADSASSSTSAAEQPAAAASSQAGSVATTTAAAAATSAAVTAPVEISYCNFNASGGNEETLKKMYEAFHKENPNITVDIETIGYDDYFTQMQTRVAVERHRTATN
jgi:multiple sugar transport system substrate-binding protein